MEKLQTEDGQLFVRVSLSISLLNMNQGFVAYRVDVTLLVQPDILDRFARLLCASKRGLTVIRVSRPSFASMKRLLPTASNFRSREGRPQQVHPAVA